MYREKVESKMFQLYLKLNDFLLLFGFIISWVNSFAEKKAMGFALFKNTFLRNQSLSNARRFYGKNAKLGRKIGI